MAIAPNAPSRGERDLYPRPTLIEDSTHGSKLPPDRLNRMTIALAEIYFPVGALATVRLGRQTLELGFVHSLDALPTDVVPSPSLRPKSAQHAFLNPIPAAEILIGAGLHPETVVRAVYMREVNDTQPHNAALTINLVSKEKRFALDLIEPEAATD